MQYEFSASIEALKNYQNHPTGDNADELANSMEDLLKVLAEKDKVLAEEFEKYLNVW